MNNTHTVKKGDTLWGIANFYKKKLQDLIIINNLYGKKKHLLQIGQKIVLEYAERKIKSEIDTILTIKLYDLEWKPIINATLLLEYDEQCFIVYSDDNGQVKDIYINDALKGIKVSFYTIKNQFEVIAHHKVLPLGTKTLKINSRAMVLKGRTYSKDGIQRSDTKIIEKELKAAAQNEKNAQEHSQTNKTQVPKVDKTTQSEKKYESEIKEKKVIDSRIENGLPATIIAPLYSEENLYLHPDNEKYRKAIITAAKKYNLTPQALAAKINAEAGTKGKGSKEWNANAQATTSSALGLTQFLSGTWYEICTKKSFRNTLVQQYVIEKKLIRKITEAVENDRSVKLDEITKSEKEKLISLSTNPNFSIDAAAAYARFNIDNIPNMPKIENLDSADLAKVAYIAHHDGLNGFVKVVNDTNYDSWDKLSGQICTKKEPNCEKLISYQDRFTSARAAYRWWLCTEYTDSKINVNKFTLNPKNEKFKEPRTAEEIIIFLGGVPLIKPSKSFSTKKEDKSKSTTNIIVTIQSFQTGKVKANLSYMIKSRYGTKPHSTDRNGNEVLKVEKGDKLEIIYNDKIIKTIITNNNNEQFKIEFPVEKDNMPPKNTEENIGTGLNFGKWRNPLNGSCQIRRFGYNSLPLKANAQKFNAENLKNATNIASRFTKTSYRNSGVHQGIDLEADNDTNIYPVCVGSISKILENYPGYGKTIILECNIKDLPEDKQKLINIKEGSVYFVYAHLNSINVKLDERIEDLNKVIGKTGNTGNAGSMSKIESGAHLHFEVRTEITNSMGKSGMKYRLDPFPLIDNCKTIEDGVTLER